MRREPAGPRPPRGAGGADPIRTRHLEIRRRVRYATRGPEDGSARELWVALHGYSQLAHRFLRHFEALDDGSRLLVAPEGLHRHYLDAEETRVGASWMTSEDRLTDIEDYVAYLDRLHGRVSRDVAPSEADGRAEGPADRKDAPAAAGGEGEEAAVARVAADAPRTVTLGFSQGVHTLCRWIAFGEARIHRAVLWGGTTPPDLDLDRHGDAFRAVDLHLIVGEDDRYFGTDAVRAHEARLERHGIPFTSHAFDGSHRLDGATLRRLAERPLPEPRAGGPAPG